MPQESRTKQAEDVLKIIFDSKVPIKMREVASFFGDIKNPVIVRNVQYAIRHYLRTIVTGVNGRRAGTTLTIPADKKLLGFEELAKGINFYDPRSKEVSRKIIGSGPSSDSVPPSRTETEFHILEGEVTKLKKDIEFWQNRARDFKNLAEKKYIPIKQKMKEIPLFASEEEKSKKIMEFMSFLYSHLQDIKDPS